jgi:PAS domain S-box-containing protein
VIGLLSSTAFIRADSDYALLGMLGIGGLVFLGLAARRTSLAVRGHVALRVAEAAQADALRSSEELLERTGATAGVGGWELDLSSMALRLTAQAYRIHDVDPVAQPTFEGFVRLYARDQQEGIRNGLAAVRDRGESYDRELPLTTPRGRKRWVRLIGRPQLEGGAVVRINGVVQDITQTKVAELALAEQHHLLDLLVKTTHEGYWFIDTEAITTDVNPAICAILGRAREQIVGRSIFDFVDGANATIFREETARRDRGEAGGYEIALRRADGSEVDCFNNATPIFDTQGRRLGSIGMFTDITERKRAEQRLIATSEQLAQKTRSLQLTLDSISQGIVSVDADRRLSDYNQRMLELLELPATLLGPGSTLDDVARFQTARGDFGEGLRFVEPGARPFVAAFDQVNVPDRYVRETRSGRCLEVRTRHLPGGALVRTYTDVTDDVASRQLLAGREAELRALLDAFPGFIAVMNAQLNYAYANDRFAALTGSPREQLIGRPVREVIGGRRFDEVLQHARRARTGERVTVESDYVSPADGGRIWLQVTYAVGADDGAGRHNVYAFGIDISARKVAEVALLAAKDEAERANLAKSQFLSSMSHELRTPMNAILGFGQLLISDAANPLVARQRDYVREILRGARHLLNLINEVLDLTLVETGKLRISLEAVQVAELLNDCMGLLQPLARQAAIEVRVLEGAACECHVLADRTRLKQVLLNLLSNAIKYNRANGQVRIGCTAEGDALRIEINDSGLGLNEDQRTRLFQAFERLEAEQTQVEGAGLGLALSQRLVHAMGGEIGLTSEVGQGSTFWIRMPRVTVPEAGALARPLALAAPLPALGPLRPRKVLYIEDNPVNVLLMEAMLARVADLQLICAPLPEMGLQMAADERPDLILLDIQLPGMDGYEVLRRLRLMEACAAIPVIAVSANAMPGDIEHGLRAGFIRYLTKPLDMEQLHAAVEAALATARSQ